MDILTLIGAYVEGLLDAEDRFIEHLDTFPELEKTVVELTNRMAAEFLSISIWVLHPEFGTNWYKKLRFFQTVKNTRQPSKIKA